VIQKLSLEASSKKALQTYQELVTEAKKLGHTEQD
jgi:homoserine dehydrogenase